MITTRRMSSHQETESCHMWTNIVSPPATTSQKLIGRLGETRLLARKTRCQVDCESDRAPSRGLSREGVHHFSFHETGKRPRSRTWLLPPSTGEPKFGHLTIAIMAESGYFTRKP